MSFSASLQKMSVEFLQNFRNIQVRFDESLQRTDFCEIMGKIGKIWAKFWRIFNLD